MWHTYAHITHLIIIKSSGSSARHWTMPKYIYKRLKVPFRRLEFIFHEELESLTDCVSHLVHRFPYTPRSIVSALYQRSRSIAPIAVHSVASVPRALRIDARCWCAKMHTTCGPPPGTLCIPRCTIATAGWRRCGRSAAFTWRTRVVVDATEIVPSLIRNLSTSLASERLTLSPRAITGVVIRLHLLDDIAKLVNKKKEIFRPDYCLMINPD